MTTSSRHEQVMDLFDAVCDLAPEAREAALDEACADDADLRREVESLIAHDLSANKAIEAAEIGGGARMLAGAVAGQSGEDVPKRIGQYSILRVIGQGGMGVVYEAQQESPRRRVALKVIRAGLASEHMKRRFRLEAEVLGRLQHPGIAHVYDAGIAETPGGPKPYFAMELVDGISLEKFVQNRKLNQRQILILMARLCDAVNHAHQKGVIHRDLKSENVLVVEQRSTFESTDSGTRLDEGSGQPKVLDFGIARLTDADVHGATLQTQAGQIVGTLAFMSPEQLSGDPSQIDTRCDVYALGVILYRLLSGQMPHDISGKPIAEAARIIREFEPARLAAIERSLAGDIDTIVTKAMEKEPERRYDSAAALAEDLRRYLANEPILAHPPSTFYQVRKFARRNVGLVTGLAATFVALVIGLSGTAYYLTEAVEQRNAAEATNTELNSVITFQSNLLEKLSARRVGEKLLVNLRSEFEQGFAELDPNEQVRSEAINNFDEMLGHVNEVNLARELLGDLIAERALEQIENKYTKNPITEARLRAAVAGIYRGIGMYPEALEQIQQATALTDHLANSNSGVRRSVLTDLAQLQARAGDYVAAETTFREVLSAAQEYSRDGSYRFFSTLNGLGRCLHKQGRLEEAVVYHERALNHATEHGGPEVSAVMTARSNLALLQAERGDYDAALQQLLKVLEFRRETRGESNADTLIALNNVMTMLFKIGRFVEAEEYARQTVDAAAATRGDDHPRTLSFKNNLGRIVLHLGRAGEAEQLFRQAYESVKVNLSPANELRQKCTSNLIDALLALRQPEEAEAIGRELIEVRRKLEPPAPGLVAQTLEQLGHAYYIQSNYAGARDAWKECVDLRSGIDPNHWLTNRARSELGAALTAQERFEEAESLLLMSYNALERQADEVPIVAGAGCLDDARARIVALYKAWGKSDEANNWAVRHIQLAPASPASSTSSSN